ncbi:uncharacterized protein K444DRAFT_652620 [Hyaloscypha bicolor E]|uniref:DUF7924 domain-containing protein n=1 Tax=Hyaloscypha bicolor E TaxID=1095630 RepID=A0A2J6TBG2_9HELO|nr:uncharacterized protein K444DRAFT_652620 [Hyaloscypha bicolor E]PMD60370.1 hypothetical protein K444DRAFT_652620 [Hyaloscypha bicolor E]
MAPRQAKRNIQKVGRQCSVPKGEQARPQGIKKERPQLSPRRSPRLRRQLTQVKFPQIKDRKRKRSQEDELILPSSATPSQKRPRKSPPQSPIKGTIGENAARRELHWPKEYFESETNMNYLLARKKSSLSFRDLGIIDTSKTVCRSLLKAEQIVPEDSLFQDNLFDETCEIIQDRNEAKSLAIRGAKRLKTLIESLKKIQPFISGFSEMSLFMGIYYIYFPFLICEVKCGAIALDIADRQNAHSMTMAVRGIIELFRLVKREKELYREILAFLVSYNNRTVRIYGHYPVINGKKTTFYRHPIREFSFTELDGKEKWTAYKFTKNIYDIWMPSHLKRICLVINELPPDLDFESLDRVSSRDVTPNTSLSQRINGKAFKKPKKRARPVELY